MAMIQPPSKRPRLEYQPRPYLKHRQQCQDQRPVQAERWLPKETHTAHQTQRRPRLQQYDLISPSPTPPASPEDGSGPEEHSIEERRAKNNALLKSRFETVFERFSHDFSNVADEIDLFADDNPPQSHKSGHDPDGESRNDKIGRIVVDRGHIRRMRNERDTGLSTLRQERVVEQEVKVGRGYLRAFSEALATPSRASINQERSSRAGSVLRSVCGSARSTRTLWNPNADVVLESVELPTGIQDRVSDGGESDEADHEDEDELFAGRYGQRSIRSWIGSVSEDEECASHSSGRESSQDSLFITASGAQEAVSSSPDLPPPVLSRAGSIVQQTFDRMSQRHTRSPSVVSVSTRSPSSSVDSLFEDKEERENEYQEFHTMTTISLPASPDDKLDDMSREDELEFTERDPAGDEQEKDYEIDDLHKGRLDVPYNSSEERYREIVRQEVRAALEEERDLEHEMIESRTEQAWRIPRLPGQRSMSVGLGSSIAERIRSMTPIMARQHSLPARQMNRNRESNRSILRAESVPISARKDPQSKGLKTSTARTTRGRSVGAESDYSFSLWQPEKQRRHRRTKAEMAIARAQQTIDEDSGDELQSAQAQAEVVVFKVKEPCKNAVPVQGILKRKFEDILNEEDHVHKERSSQAEVQRKSRATSGSNSHSRSRSNTRSSVPLKDVTNLPGKLRQFVGRTTKISDGARSNAVATRGQEYRPEASDGMEPVAGTSFSRRAKSVDVSVHIRDNSDDDLFSRRRSPVHLPNQSKAATGGVPENPDRSIKPKNFRAHSPDELSSDTPEPPPSVSAHSAKESAARSPSPELVNREGDIQEEWEVESVVDSKYVGRGKNRKLQYRVIWKGYDAEWCPWEDILPGCDSLVQEYHTTKPKKAGPPEGYVFDFE